MKRIDEVAAHKENRFMTDEERWSKIGNITLKLTIQMSNLIDICEGQQKIISNLVERVGKLEDILKSNGIEY
jgi:hypothetical protein